jgi:hypothetical protein
LFALKQQQEDLSNMLTKPPKIAPPITPIGVARHAHPVMQQFEIASALSGEERNS